MALCGILLYSVLIPGHIVSQAMSAMAGSGIASTIAGFTPALCHSDVHNGATAPGTPVAPEKKCPFCIGYSSFVVASMAPASIAVLAVEKVSPARVTFEAAVVWVALRVPQNRGPPSQSA
ncbi:MAG: DUF2946 family protein [Terriglobales bacterium]